MERESASARVQRLARQFGAQGAETVQIYILAPSDEPAGPRTVNRIRGAPIGVADPRWPRFGRSKNPSNAPMEHVLTLDLATLPGLRELPSLKEARALALFVSKADDNSAFDRYTDETVLVRLSEQEVATGQEAAMAKGEPVRTFSVTPVDVPAEVFEKPLYEDELEALEPDQAERAQQLQELRDALYALPGRVLGEPLWMQSDESTRGTFILQFDESLVPMNLGDAGIMYVFTDTAFWQCH